jgi:glycosyltransferase involved in cell wall biosynthesis
VSRGFLICPEPVRHLTAGVGTRFLTLAKVLGDHGHQITLACPNDPQQAASAPAGVTFVEAQPDQLGAQAEGHDWVMIHGHLGNHYLAQRDDQPVIVDLYDPFMIENFHYAPQLGFAPYRTDHATWRLQMSRGDLFLCSSEEQRLYYLGWLTALGRVNPLTTEDDPLLDRLIVSLPFGTPEEPPPPVPDRADVLSGLPDDPLVLYYGGIYDWYDPEVVLAAMPALLSWRAGTVVVFVEHPHPDLTPLSVAGRVRAAAESRGWLGTSVRFEGWRPFDRRFDLPLVCDLAVVTHRPSFETELSLRTRLVDLLWLGLPVIVTEGGAMARIIREQGAGVVIEPGNPDALVRAIKELVEDPRRRHKATENARAWAVGQSWPRVAAPLLEFAARPWRDPHRSNVAAVDPGAIKAREPLRRRIRRAIQRRLGDWR